MNVRWTFTARSQTAAVNSAKWVRVIKNAQLAELVDALVSGTSVRKYVKVRVFSWAPSDTVTGRELKVEIYEFNSEFFRLSTFFY